MFKKTWPGIIISSVYLVASFASLGSYAYTWDYPHHYNAGIKRLEYLTKWDLSWMPRQDRVTFGDQPYGPIADSLPVLSQIIFHYKLNWLPADVAYHLPLTLASALGIFVFSQFLLFNFSFLISILGTGMLILYPRWIGHSHNNPKDTLSAVFFALAIISIHNWIKELTSTSDMTIDGRRWKIGIDDRNWRVEKSQIHFQPSIFKSLSSILHHPSSNLLLASVSTALAFNMKVNAILIPPILALWLLISFPRDLLRRPLFFLFHFSFFIFLAILFSISIWSLFWPQPLYHLQDLVAHFSTGTTGFPIFYYGKIYQANISVPWHFALGYLAAVTPVPVILFFVIGFFKAVSDIVRVSARKTEDRKQKTDNETGSQKFDLRSSNFNLPNQSSVFSPQTSINKHTSALLLAWFLVPTLKYINPHVGVLDDIRHYLEVVFPLTALAAIGANHLITQANKLLFGMVSMSHVHKTERGDSTHERPANDVAPSHMARLRRATNNRVTANLPLKVIASLTLTIYLAIQAYSLHPYQTSYYSEWLGGLSGVAKRNLFDVEFWGNTLKEGSAYLNRTAPLNSVVWVPMAQQVAREYLRPDLIVTQQPPASQGQALRSYLMVFNRYSMLATQFGINTDLYPIINYQKPLFQITRDDTPLLWVFKP